MPESAGKQSPVRILIVEDDSVTRSILGKLFDSFEIPVEFAENGAKGLEVFNALRPELVISDYSMPEMNGIDMLRVIKDKSPRTKLALMTIYTESEVLINAINIGVDRFIEKPVTKDKLHNAVSGLLEDIRRAKELTKYQNLLKAYRSGVDASTIFSIIDADGNFTYVNDNFCSISGYEENELLGKHYSIIRKLYDINDIKLNWYENISGTIWQGVVMNTDRDGRDYVTEVSLMPVYNDNSLTGFISIEKDMSFLVSSHKTELQAFFDADTSVMFSLGTAGGLSGCNRSFLEFFGFSNYSEAADGGFCLQNYIDRGGSDEDWSVLSGTSGADGFFEALKKENIKKLALKKPNDDKEYFFTVNYFTLDQKYLGLDDLRVVRLNDITELENFRKDELSSAMLASIGKLAAGITHEINTPLTYIKGNIELLEWEVDEHADAGSLETMKEYFSSINDGIDRISTIIDSMREVTGEAVFEMQQVNLYSTFVVAGRMIFNRAKHVAPIFLNGKLLTPETDANAEVYMTSAAPRMLEQVWIILMNNSLDQLSNTDLTFDKKYIKINIEPFQGGRHLIRLTDNGGGIDPKVLKRLFELFSSTKKHNGMGIGLNIAKSIIDKHKGSINPYNTPDGALFEIII